MEDLFDIDKLLKQVEEVKKYCREHRIDWDEIDCGYKPKIMLYSSQGMLW